jgi:polyvinyl alcohol dehydrogenase (cytochrome)
MSPTIENGIVYQGVSSLEELAAANPAYPCCSFAGSMAALNADTGAIIWKTYMMPLEDAGIGKYAGCSVWGSSPPVDANNVYIATGNLYELPDDVADCVHQCEENPETCIGKPPCVPENIHFDSVLALNKLTGEIVWNRRLETADAWNVACLFGLPVNCPIPTGPDFDFAQAPIIFGKDGLVIGQKSGVVWGLNRLTGEVRWSNAVEQGGFLGGFQWGSSLASDKNGVLTWIGASANSGDKPVTFPNGMSFNGSSIIAINPYTGKTKWRTAVPLPSHSYGAVSSSNEVAFAPAFESGTMTAYSVQDGKPLWSFQTNATLHGGPSISGKRVIFGNGYQAIFSGTVGRNVYCFKVHDDHC